MGGCKTFKWLNSLPLSKCPAKLQNPLYQIPGDQADCIPKDLWGCGKEGKVWDGYKCVEKSDEFVNMIE
jgi:hypothetical protein